MSVNWYWKHKLGYISYRDLRTNKLWKLELFGGNMMTCFIYRYKQEGEMYYNFFTWLNDINHAKRCLKHDKDYLRTLPMGNHKLIRIKIKVTSKEYKYSNQEMLKFAKLLAEYGYPVTLY